ncbi:hypothetical protein HY488_01290 [Candidatus Woesearchaeota archaeon]|nr:hypothetical protein [Candidatus Woesearchaeota archaeon]
MKLVTHYKRDIENLFAKRYVRFGVSIERLRFFARKTVKYGHLVQVKVGKQVLPAYYCWFYSGFGVYVVYWDLPQVAYDEQKIFAVIIENPAHDDARATIKRPPSIFFAVDWFYPS